MKELVSSENYTSFFVNDDVEYRAIQQSIPALLDGATLTPEEFYEFERAKIPAVIKGIPAGYDGGREAAPWPAVENWKFEALQANRRLLHRRFKCGEDDDGRNIKIKLKTFLKYTRFNRDDSPLYVFDSGFDEDKHADQLLKDYRVPTYFSDDLFSLVSERRRPPYRWFLVGPERSGTCVHIDPLATSAWNTLIEGQKRWVLFPPYLTKDIVKGKGLIRDDEDDEGKLSRMRETNLVLLFRMGSHCMGPLYSLLSNTLFLVHSAANQKASKDSQIDSSVQRLLLF